jgi:hypothetical protein
VPLTEEEEAQDLKFYMEQIYLIIKVFTHILILCLACHALYCIIDYLGEVHDSRC